VDLVGSPTRGGSLSLAHPGLPSSHASGVQEASPEGWQEMGCGFGRVANPGWLAIARTPRATILARLRRARSQPGGLAGDYCWRGSGSSHPSGVQEASPEGWREISPGWSASDTRGFSFNASRTPEGCGENLDSSFRR
jgi:hypothetical protein